MAYSSSFIRPINLAINGFGRIGRNVLRAYLERQCQYHNHEIAVNIVAINDIASAQNLLHLLKYDSTHGRLDSRWPISAKLDDTSTGMVLIVTTPRGQQRIRVLQQVDPLLLPWQDLNVDIVLESTGHFRRYAAAYQHIEAGAKQVIVGAAPFDKVDASIVLGVNDNLLTTEQKILSGVSCTTQAIVPLLHVLDEALGIEAVMMTEIHAVTADQTVLDQGHRDARRGRAAGYNIIPTTSSSVAAVTRVLPNMAGRFNGHSIRVPTMDVAAIDVTFSVKTTTSVNAINELLANASQHKFQGIMGFSTEPLVSSDFIHQPESLVIDSLQTMQTGQDIEGQALYKVFAWYDNEWGYANRMLDICEKLAPMYNLL